MVPPGCAPALACRDLCASETRRGNGRTRARLVPAAAGFGGRLERVIRGRDLPGARTNRALTAWLPARRYWVSIIASYMLLAWLYHRAAGAVNRHPADPRVRRMMEAPRR